MTLLYKHEYENVYFSRNGNRAYLAGEKPLFMWPKGASVQPTVKHHIARPRGQPLELRNYSRELVMFYRLKA